MSGPRDLAYPIPVIRQKEMGRRGGGCQREEVYLCPVIADLFPDLSSVCFPRPQLTYTELGKVKMAISSQELVIQAYVHSVVSATVEPWAFSANPENQLVSKSSFQYHFLGQNAPVAVS